VFWRTVSNHATVLQRWPTLQLPPCRSAAVANSCGEATGVAGVPVRLDFDVRSNWRKPMKTLVLASILSTVALTAAAQPVSDSSTVTITPKGPVIVAPSQPRAMSRDEFSHFIGSYELSNGDSIALFTRGLKKYAALHGEARHELVAASGNSFVAKDRQLKVTFVSGDDGEVVGGEVLMAMPADRLAAAKAHKQAVVQSLAMR
jgi:hypothetical protein